jgi:hypothetical protein
MPDELTVSTPSRFRRMILLAVMALGLVTGAAVVTATSASANQGSTGSAATSDSSGSSSTETQEEGQGESGRNCPERGASEDADV